jgi:hypothetical protein
LHGRIISLREGVWVHKASLTPLIVIEGSVISQESEWSCIIMLGVSILPFSMILIFDLELVPQCGIFFSLFTFYYYTNETYHHDIIGILLKALTLNT